MVSILISGFYDSQRRLNAFNGDFIVVKAGPVTDSLGCSLDIVIYSTNDFETLDKLLHLVIAPSMVPDTPEVFRGLSGQIRYHLSVNRSCLK